MEEKEFYLIKCNISKEYPIDDWDENYRIFASNFINTFNGIKIPSMFNKKKIVSIGYKGFSNINSRFLMIEKGIKCIENQAFYNSSFDIIFVPNGIEYIDNALLESCSCKEIYFETGIKELDDLWFKNTQDEDIILHIPDTIEKINFTAQTNYKFIIDKNNINFKFIDNCLIDLKTDSIVYIYDNGNDLNFAYAKNVKPYPDYFICQDKLLFPDGIETIKLNIEKIDEPTNTMIFLPKTLKYIEGETKIKFEKCNIILNSLNPYLMLIDGKILPRKENKTSFVNCDCVCKNEVQRNKHTYRQGVLYHNTDNKTKMLEGIICDEKTIVGKGILYNENGGIKFDGCFESKEEYENRVQHSCSHPFSELKHGLFYDKNETLQYKGILRPRYLGTCSAGMFPYGFPNVSSVTGLYYEGGEPKQFYLDSKPVCDNNSIVKAINQCEETFDIVELSKMFQIKEPGKIIKVNVPFKVYNETLKKIEEYVVIDCQRNISNIFDKNCIILNHKLSAYFIATNVGNIVYIYNKKYIILSSD